MNVIFIGYRGAGKSRRARLLSKRIGREIVSTDLEIEKKEGNIPDLVSKKGWEYFRMKEREIIKEISLKDKIIIDAGGGAVISKANAEELKRNGLFIYIEAGVETLKKRISKNPKRPALSQKKADEEIEDILAQRKPIYEKLADFTEGGDKSPGESVERIISFLKQKKVL